MLHSRGFSLLEIMLALVVVAIGISVLLTFSKSSQHETASKSIGNDYSLVVNDILEQFLLDVQSCNDGSSQTICKRLKDVANMSAKDYLETKNQLSITSDQENALKEKGIDLDKIVINISASRSDS